MKRLLTIFAAVLLCLLSCSKNEYVPVNMIALDNFDLQMTLYGDPKFVHATVLPSNATKQNLVWESQDETVATVSQAGKVTAQGVGKTWVLVTAEDNGVNTRFKVTVSDVGVLVTNLALDPQDFTIRMGSDVKRITANIFPVTADDKTLLWTSSDENVVIVEDGLVAPVGNGSATIKAVAKVGGASASCTVLVKPQNAAWVAAESVTLDKIRLNLYIGGTDRLRATVLPYETDSKDVLWESTDESVASVTGGLVFANKAGTATITVRTRDGGYTAGCDVTVTDPEEE